MKIIKDKTYSNQRMSSLRKYIGKQLVSYLRQGDFAHAGEVDAIDLVMRYFNKDMEQSILDAGCGLGGTAQYIQNQKWGTLSGFDIETEAVKYARENYPSVNFFSCDVADADQVINKSFDIICLFNSFYAFSDQHKALKVLNNLAKSGGKIALFDYSDPYENEQNPLFRPGSENITPFIPIKLNKINLLLQNTGWAVLDTIDISSQYSKWYKQLIDNLVNNKAEILNKFNLDAFEHALNTYLKIKKSIDANALGGVIIYAQKI